VSEQRPAVSVCIPVYNALPYLPETFASVLRQTFADWELVLVENCSKDGSREVAQRLVAEAADPRCRVHLNEEHLDMAGNMNRALTIARGEFVKLLCADDIIEPRCLERQVAALRDHPNVVLAGCTRQIVGPTGKVAFARSAFPKSGVYAGRDVIRRCLWAGTNLIGEPTSVLLRTADLQSIPLLDPETRYWIDFDFWTRLLMRGDMYFDTEPLAQFRIHGSAATRTFERIMLEDFLTLAARRLSEMGSRLGIVQRLWLHAKVRALNLARRIVYQRIGGRAA
jgi:glycosyltransferase involved in cell wall biosynthesis